MTIALALEDFGAGTLADTVLFPAFSSGPGAGSDAVSPEERAEAEAEAAATAQYEEGYRAGWEDCDRNLREKRLVISEELARSLQDLAFTYHEARAHVLAMVEPVLQAMAEHLLPGLAQEAFPRIVIAELAAIAAEDAELPPAILVSPQCVDQVRALLGDAPALACEVRGEDSLQPFQALFRAGRHERLLDIDGVLARIAAATAAISTRAPLKAALG